MDGQRILITSGLLVELLEQPFQLRSCRRDDGAIGEEFGALAGIPGLKLEVTKKKAHGAGIIQSLSQRKIRMNREVGRNE